MPFINRMGFVIYLNCFRQNNLEMNQEIGLPIMPHFSFFDKTVHIWYRMSTNLLNLGVILGKIPLK